MMHKLNQTKRRHKKIRFDYILLTVGLLAIVILALPVTFVSTMSHEQSQPTSGFSGQFPVTVDPQNKIITENPRVNALLEGANSPLEANALGAIGYLWNAIKSVGISIANAPWYQNLASVATLNNRVITITSGMRKEQVADTFAKALSWSNQQKISFLTADKDGGLPLSEGSYFPGTYIMEKGATPSTTQALINKRFSDNVLAHYGTSTAKLVPLYQALTLASIIQRETIGNDDMRLISGIIWNRLFINMNLQVDATLQYVKANTKSATEWWPDVSPNDKYIKSPYNTYLHPGLPPTPIANPSVGAILAALNPIKTDCLFYFNDKKGNFHCSATYAEHVKLIKQFYGGGK